MRSNKVWDEETAERAGLPVVTEGNEKQDNVFELNDNNDKKEGFLESFPLVEGDGVRCLPITAAAAPSTIEDTADEEKSFL